MGDFGAEETRLPSGSEEWEWGEVYIWGGVTWTPAPPLPVKDQAMLDKQFAAAEARAALSDAAPAVWKAVVDQYRAAARAGDFAGVPLSPVLAGIRFGNLVNCLDISVSEALQLVRQDATPLLVDADGVAHTFKMLTEMSSREKALELIGKHPGLLVGGVQSLQEGCSLVSAALVQVFFAGRLRQVLEDQERDKSGKIKEVEFYACIASMFKPVMDLAQRRSKDLSIFLAIPGIPLILKMLSVSSPKDFGLDGHEWSEAAWALDVAGLVVAVGFWGLGFGSWTLAFGAWVLQVATWLLGMGTWKMDNAATPTSPMVGARFWSLWIGACVLLLGSGVLKIESWIASVFPPS